MRLHPVALALSTTLATGVVVGVPVTAATAERPRPVAVSVDRVGVAGVDRAAERVLPGPLSRRPLLLTAARSTSSYSTVGVTWRRDPRVTGLAVQVRSRTGGAWSEWRHLEVDSDHGPDEGSAEDAGVVRDGTAPLWVGRSTGVQVRVDRRSGAVPRDVRVELVDPGASPADAPARSPRASARAASTGPEIVTRAQWGADESLRNDDTPTYTGAAKVGFVHHTASAGSYSPEQAAAMVRSVYAFHTQSRGWDDLGYNFLVDRYGRVYEGRAGGIDKWVLGSHTGGHNSNSFAVSLLGTFDKVAPPAVALDALERTLAWKLALAYRDPRGTAQLRSGGGGTSRFAAGTTQSFAVVSGHRDAGLTACPGAATYARMGEIRAGVARHLGPGFVAPALDGQASLRSPAAGTSEGTPEGTSGGAPAGSFSISTRTVNRTEWTLQVSRGGQVVRTLTGVADGPLRTGWDLTFEGGAPALPGTYALRLTGRDAAGVEALPWSTTVRVEGGGTSRWRPVTR